MYDLIYCADDEMYDDIVRIIRAKLPEAKLEGASDDIHPYRFSVTLEDDSKEKDYIKLALAEGFFTLSFHIQVLLREDNARIMEYVKEIAKENEMGKETVRND